MSSNTCVISSFKWNHLIDNNRQFITLFEVFDIFSSYGDIKLVILIILAVLSIRFQSFSCAQAARRLHSLGDNGNSVIPM